MSHPYIRRGLFITFEGAEGSGKSTQIRRLAASVRRKGRRVLALREPGGTRAGEAIRRILLDSRRGGSCLAGRRARTVPPLTPETELLLFLAARAQLVREKIVPALRAGTIVICDRFEDSTLAYQGYGRGIPVETIRKIWRLVSKAGARSPGTGKGAGTRPLSPDLTFILDITPRRGMARGGRRDRIEKESLKFHKRVRRGFLTLARRKTKKCQTLFSQKASDTFNRYVVIDAGLPIETVAQKIREHLDRVLK